MTHTTKILLTVLVLTATIFIYSSLKAGPVEGVDAVRIELIKMVPPAEHAPILETDVKGVYRIELESGFYYAYVDGDHILFGDLVNTASQINLGERAKLDRTAKLIDGAPIDKMIVYGPKDAKRHVTVFTDIDCGYCRKLHLEVPKLNEAGVQVRYLAFPRAGVGSESHKKYVSVWCNADQQTALTDAKAGKNVPPASCDNPIAETYELGRKAGVSGTPTIILDDGTVTPGYVPYTVILERLGIAEQAGE